MNATLTPGTCSSYMRSARLTRGATCPLIKTKGAMSFSILWILASAAGSGAGCAAAGKPIHISAMAKRSGFIAVSLEAKGECRKPSYGPIDFPQPDLEDIGRSRCETRSAITIQPAATGPAAWRGLGFWRCNGRGEITVQLFPARLLQKLRMLVPDLLGRQMQSPGIGGVGGGRGWGGDALGRRN